MDHQAVRELELGSTKDFNHIFHLLYFGADRYDDPASVTPGRCTLGAECLKDLRQGLALRLETCVRA